jgi:hypothetical protein
MTTWTRLKYGSMLAAGLAATGGLIWFGAGGRVVTAVHLVELFEGTAERCYATQTVAGTNVVHTWSNQAPNWVVDPAITNLYYLYDTNNVATPTNYLAISGSNWVQYAWTNDSGTYRIPPPVYALAVSNVIGRRVVSTNPWQEALVHEVDYISNAITRVASANVLADRVPLTGGLAAIGDKIRGQRLFGGRTPGLIHGATSGYVDDTLAGTNGAFSGLATLPVMTTTGLWSRLEIDNVLDGIVAFSYEHIGVLGLVMQNRVVSSNALAEPYRALEALRWTGAAAGGYTNAGVPDVYLCWSGEGATWEDAQSVAKTNLVAAYRAGSIPPMQGTYGYAGLDLKQA